MQVRHTGLVAKPTFSITSREVPQKQTARLAGPYGRGTGFPAGLLFPYQSRKSDGCNLLKTKLEFASSSKADCPLGRAIRKRNPLPWPDCFSIQIAKKRRLQ